MSELDSDFFLVQFRLGCNCIGLSDALIEKQKTIGVVSRYTWTCKCWITSIKRIEQCFCINDNTIYSDAGTIIQYIFR